MKFLDKHHSYQKESLEIWKFSSKFDIQFFLDCLTVKTELSEHIIKGMFKPSPAKPITSEAVLHLHSEKATIWIISLEVIQFISTVFINFQLQSND